MTSGFFSENFQIFFDFRDENQKISKIIILSFDEINHTFFLGARITRRKRCPMRPAGPETRSPRSLDGPRYPVFLLTPFGRKVTTQNVPRTTLKKGEWAFPIAFVKGILQIPL